MKAEFVGILLDESISQGIPKGHTKTEAINFYDKAGIKYGLKPCYFSLSDLSVDGTQVNAYIRFNHSYVRKRIPVPKIIHNRTLVFSNAGKQAMSQLEKNGIIIFNRRNRYSKLQIHSFLSQEPNLLPYLPDTLPGSLSNLKMMIEKYQTVILKPSSGSLGKGVLRVQKTNDNWVLSSPQKKGKKHTLTHKTFSNKIPFEITNKLKNQDYVIQEGIPIALYHGRPFDLRVSVQKNEHGNWHLTGIVAKSAQPGHFLCNVAQGGTVYPLHLILSKLGLNYDQVYERVSTLALRIVKTLNAKISGLSDLGLDIAITQDGHPFFIECNGRDQRYSFRNGGMYQTWEQTYTHPIGYARFLYDHLEKSVDNQFI